MLSKIILYAQDEAHEYIAEPGSSLPDALSGQPTYIPTPSASPSEERVQATLPGGQVSITATVSAEKAQATPATTDAVMTTDTGSAEKAKATLASTDVDMPDAGEVIPSY